MRRRGFLLVAVLSPLLLYSKDSNYYTSLFKINTKLNLIKKTVGYGNFNIITFDKALNIAKHYKSIGYFTKNELELMELIFYADARKFGFYGKRTCYNITESIPKNDVIKIPYSGHYVYKDRSYYIYRKLTKDIGNDMILTSGVRSVVKQMNLFFTKILKCNGDIKKASHSIAPPGYSYHSIGDFDVGEKGWGYKNFTSYFENSEVFNRLKELKYVSIRYTPQNKDGVRYEPWHVRIV